MQGTSSWQHAQRSRLTEGRWHFRHGPIDLIIGAEGDPGACTDAMAACWSAFQSVLATLVSELAWLRSDCRALAANRQCVQGPVAQRMLAACQAHAGVFDLFVTPMAAVAGSVADELIVHFERPGVRRAFINNGGDIALWLAPGQSYVIGMIGDVADASVEGHITIDASSTIRGVASSGWRGRSQSLGIADNVTVLAATAAAADAAATLVANAVDVEHPAVRRLPATQVREQSDLGERLVTVDVAPLPGELVDLALERGLAHAERCRSARLIEHAALRLQGRWRSTVMPVDTRCRAIEVPVPSPVCSPFSSPPTRSHHA